MSNMDIKIDTSQLLALASDTPEVLVPIVEQFHENAVELINSMREALKISDHSGILSYVHQLKGSSGTLGMVSLYESCLSLEKGSAESINDEVLGNMLELVEKSVQLTLTALAG